MKASKAIQLVLIGSAAILLGCEGCDDDKNRAATTRPARSSYTHGGHWWRSGRSYGGGSSVSHGSSSRGGFGASGVHAGS